MQLKPLILSSFFLTEVSRTKNKIYFEGGTNNFKFVLSIALIVVNSFMLMSYVYGVNESASQGYEIQSLQKKLSNLSDENKKINMKIAESTSMVVIQKDFLNANFVNAGTPKFLEIQHFSQR